jgi:MATE family multidrug resistance protein
MNKIDKSILRIALPSIVSNITVPLLGLIDVSIVGHLGAAAYIGAIAVGTMMFNVVYWLFAFLRMGTTGMTSQALGARNLDETVRLLVRSLGIGLAVSAVLLLVQGPLREGVLLLLRPTDEVASLASLYFDICIWGAPAVLSLYAFSGWFVGMQNSKAPMLVAIVQNAVNIVASLVLVFGAGMKVEGVALGTLIAQYAGLAVAAALWLKFYRRLTTRGGLVGGKPSWHSGLWGKDALVRFFKVNTDILLRTMCLVAVTMYFTSAGASQGDTILAVNTLLMQLFTLFSYFMDGFAFAGEALVGKAVGARSRTMFVSAMRRLFVWGAAVASVFMLLYALGGRSFLEILTDDASVVSAALDYMPYAVLIPLCGVCGFIMDGVFIGATATRQMLVSMSVAAVSFFAIHLSFRSGCTNDALWVAFLAYLFLRGAVQLLLVPKVLRKVQ